MTTEFNLSTPPLLFSAISLILLAYTNRFLSYASTVRSLKERYENNPEGEPTSLKQIENLYRRLALRLHLGDPDLGEGPQPAPTVHPS